MNKLLIALFFFFFFFLSFFVSGIVDSQDGLQYLAVARNLYYKHEPTAPVYEYGNAGGWKNIHMSTYVGRNGKTYSMTGLGFSLAMVPSVALTDVFYKLYNMTPSIHFPLESDWIIFFITSFTNIFFAAILAVTIFSFLILIKVAKKNSLIISILAFLTTNLFAFSKHITAHMMFVCFLTLTFYFLKKYSINKRRLFIFLSGVAFGILIITYNNTFMLTIPSIVIYYLLVNRAKISRKLAVKIFKDLLIFALGVLPFFALYLWYENIRAPVDAILSSPTFLASYLSTRTLKVPFAVFFEGIYGQLLSPGRSLFIYSPLLLIPFIFWHKFKKDIVPEIISWSLLAFIYILFYSTLYSDGGPGQGITALWSGEASWGPRYLAPLIPFGVILAGYIYQKVNKLGKILVFLPLSLIGLYVEILGILMPYQIKLHYLDADFYVNGTEYTSYAYSNLLPRYSPLIMMSKNLIRLAKNFKSITFPGNFNVRFYDGIDFAFDVGPERWRAIEGQGYISFDNKPNNVNSISFDIINHPLATTKDPLSISFILNGTKMNNTPYVLKIGERKNITLKIDSKLLKSSNNILRIHTNFITAHFPESNTQLSAIINMWINDKLINKEYISVPYISELGPKTAGIVYKNWGGTNTDPWLSWNIHTQVYERAPDLWWLRPAYYWDINIKPLIALFILCLVGLFISGRSILKVLKTQAK
jgi:hypothetical protein